MERYQKYQPIKSLWNLEFPAHWEVLPLCSIAKEKSVCNCTDMNLLSVYLDDGVVPFSERTEKRTNTTSKDLSKYQRVDIGDFVLNNQQAWRGSVGVSKYSGITSPAYIILSLNDQLSCKYANYLFRSRIMVDQYLIASKGVGSIQRNLYWPELKRASVLIPPRSEQDQIVRYLDWKVSSINRLIHGYQRQIKLLEEYKRTLVDSVVTKGLNPNVKMKDSGVYWLGNIPENWNVIRAKFLFKREKREPLKSDEVVTCFRDGEVTLRKNRRTTGFTESLQENGYQHVCKGDLVIHTMDAFAGSIGISDSDGKGTPVYQCCTPLRTDIYVPYYMHFLRMMAHVGYILSLYRGIRERSSNFTFDVFSAQMLAMPSFEEQQEIVDYIEKITLQINLLKRKIASQISYFEEYRTRLISDVVTGQVDVRGIEIPDYTPEEETDMADVTKEIEDTEVDADAESDE